MDAPFKLLHLDHVVLRSAQPDALVTFYCLLGGSEERILPELGLTQVRFGQSIIDVIDTNGQLGRILGAAPSDDGGRNLDHFAVRIEPFDADALAAFAEQHDIAWQLQEKLYGADGFGPAIYLSDPDGNRIELKGPPIE